MNKFYDEINKALSSYETYKPYHIKSIDWICNRIDWCWKWRKITKEQKDELCDRVIYILEGELFI